MRICNPLVGTTFVDASRRPREPILELSTVLAHDRAPPPSRSTEKIRREKTEENGNVWNVVRENERKRNYT
jgi:hypothetical protein